MTPSQLARLVQQAAIGQDSFMVRCGPSDTLTEHDGAEIETEYGTYLLSVLSPKAATATLAE
jgi:hypothetical protein